MLAKLLPYHERPAVFRRAVGWGLVVQLLNVLVVVELGQALGLRIPLLAYFNVVPVVAVLTLLPVSVSGVGVREGGLVWMLAAYGVGQGMGITLGVLWFLVTVAGGLVGGLAYLFGAKSLATDADGRAAGDCVTAFGRDRLRRQNGRDRRRQSAGHRSGAAGQDRRDQLFRRGAGLQRAREPAAALSGADRGDASARAAV